MGAIPSTALRASVKHACWNDTGSMTTARASHTATLLPGGKVLIVGGSDASSTLATAELYDPVAGTFTATGTMATARCWHTATLLPSGQVLIAGGTGDAGSLASAELYDPPLGTFTATGNMTATRETFTATLLSSGEVLIAGGLGSSGNLASAELYDPPKANPQTKIRSSETSRANRARPFHLCSSCLSPFSSRAAGRSCCPSCFIA